MRIHRLKTSEDHWNIVIGTTIVGSLVRHRVNKIQKGSQLLSNKTVQKYSARLDKTKLQALTNQQIRVEPEMLRIKDFTSISDCMLAKRINRILGLEVVEEPCKEE